MALVGQPENDNCIEYQSADNITTDILNNEFVELIDGMSDLSTNFSSLGQRFPVFMSEEVIHSTEIQILLETKNIDPKSVTSDPKFENQKRRFQLPTPEHSDGEDGECNSDMVDCEETPSLHLREYQKELAEKALKGRNTIICAPTGSGKTRIATHIILNHLLEGDTAGSENDTAGSEKRTRKIAFLARTVPLVMQQCKSLKKYLPKKFEVTSLTGDSEDSMHLHMILPDNDVIVMTPRILENHLNKKCLPHLGVFSMLIFDECHHTRKGEPYNTLMYSYLKTKKHIQDMKTNGEKTDIRLPQIVGLTASISVEKAVKVDEAVNYILKVCGNLDADSISCVEKNLDELKKTVPVPIEKLQKLREVENDEAVKKIMGIMGKLERTVTHHAGDLKNDQLNALLKKIPNDKKSQQYGQWAVKVKNIVKTIPRKENRETISSVRALMIIADYLSAYNVALELHDLVLMEHVIEYLDKSFVEFSQNENRSSNEDSYFRDFTEFKDLMKSRLRAENPNLTILKKTLSEHLIAKGSKSCGIIFVRTRALTEALASWLNTCDDNNLQNLKATIFTGTGASVDDGGMTTAEQDEILQRFNSGDIKLLVATSVGEEGIDIAECNLVIKYNHVGNEVTTVQTRGRSRKAGGMSILLAMDKIIKKERINQEKSKLMEAAIVEIRKMKRSKIRKMNIQHQQQILREEEILQIVKQKEESLLFRKEFKMVCQLCRKVVIDSKDIKTIFHTHHVVVNRNILSQTKTIPYKKALYFDEIKVIGSVRCMGEPEEGKHCYNKIGSMMVCSKIPFVVLGIKNFGFDLNNPLGLEFHSQWKKVPYVIDEIEPSDFKRYLNENKVVKEINDKSDDVAGNDEDSDDDDDDKVSTPFNKSVEPVRSSSAEQSQVTLSSNSDITTELKNAPSSLGVNNSDRISATETKRLQSTSDSHGDKDSGISGASPEHNYYSRNHLSNTEGAKSHENLKVSNIIANIGSASAQISVKPSLRSGDKHYHLSLGHIKQSPSKILSDVVSLESKLSTFQSLPDELMPSIQFSEESGNSQVDSNTASVVETSQVGDKIVSAADTSHVGDNISAAETSQVGNNIISSADTSQIRDNNTNAAETSQVRDNILIPAENKQAWSNNLSAAEISQIGSNILNTAEACRIIQDDNKDITVPKEMLSERNGNTSGQNRQSRQNSNNENSTSSHSLQPMSGLNLL